MRSVCFFLSVLFCVPLYLCVCFKAGAVKRRRPELVLDNVVKKIGDSACNADPFSFLAMSVILAYSRSKNEISSAGWTNKTFAFNVYTA